MKIQRIGEFQSQLNFSTPNEQYSLYYDRFLSSELGSIYQAIPWGKLVKALGIRRSRKGPCSIFDARGKLALMFLKHYSSTSDRKLTEQINGNIDYQFFCGIYLGHKNRIKNYKIVSSIRCELAAKLDIDKLQGELASYWRPYMTDRGHVLIDATCYESAARYPTNVKLLWEATDWSYTQMRGLCKLHGLRTPRTKYLKWAKRYHSYSRKRRKPGNEKRALTRSLLLLLSKINACLDVLDKGGYIEKDEYFNKRRKVIKKLLQQQHQYFHQGKKPHHRIVHIHKDYLRPIVRGKEVKKVEFGAKVNKLQIDGINFIEHLDFEAFNEGVRLMASVHKARLLTREPVTLIGADAIYANNRNRKYTTQRGIRTDFTRKGRASKYETQRKQLASMITKERASRLEGSFGNEKEHYHLKSIRAMTKKTEILWIFFGIHTANAVEVGRRMAVFRSEKAA